MIIQLTVWRYNKIIRRRMKGQLSVDPTFRNLQIKRPTIHLLKPLVVTDGRKLHLEGRSIPWEGKGIINCTFSIKYDVLLILCDDWKLHIFNQNLDEISKLANWESKYSVAFHLIEELNIFLLIGVSQIEILKANIITNVKKTKFLSSVKFGIQRKEIIKAKQMPKDFWNKGYGFNLSDKLLYVWSIQDVLFYDLNKLELKSEILKLVKKEQAITYVYYNQSYRYTATGLINGNLRIWRLPLSKNGGDCIMIHNCIYHTKAIEKIIPGNDDRVIISYSADLTMCLWSLETFELLRFYNFSAQYSQLYLVNHHKAYAMQNSFLGELMFGKTMEFITEISSQIMYFDKFKMKGEHNEKRIVCTQVTLGSNMAFQIRNNSLAEKDLNKIDIPYFYPPLKAKSITQVISSPFHHNQYYMLVESGDIYRVRIQNNSGQIQQCYNIERTHDIQNHSLNQKPTLIKFLEIIPPHFDSEITQNSILKKPEADSKEVSHNLEEYENLQLICIGCDRGSIIFLSLLNMEVIRTRLTYHRESINSIQAIRVQTTNQDIIVSICNENYIKFIKFDGPHAHCYFSLHFQPNFKFISTFQDKLVLVFTKGSFQIVDFSENADDMPIYLNLDAIDHEGEIYSLDYQENKKLILTSAADNKIKIWTSSKLFIYEIKLDEGLTYAIWSNNLEILVAHNMKILYLRDLPLSINIQDIQAMNTQFKSSNKAILSNLKEMFASVKNTLSKEKIPDKIRANNYSSISGKKSSLNKALETNSMLRQEEIIKIYDILKDQKPKIYDILKDQKPKIKRFKSKSRKKASTSLGGISKLEEEEKRKAAQDLNLKVTQNHLQEINNLKKMTNESLLPRIQPRHEDKFEEFIQAKLISKKMLTRRDITINRIIMKNLIKEQFNNEDEGFNSLKLDF